MSSEDYLAHLTPDAFVVYPGRSKLVFFSLLAAAFIAVGFFVWSNDRSDRFIAILDWVFFGFGLLLFLARLIWRVPSLIVNQMGIYDNGAGFSGYFLRWEEIDSIYTSSIGRGRFVSIRLKDPEAFLSRQGPIKAKLMRANVKLVGAPVNIATNVLTLKEEELIAIIQQKSAARVS